MFVMYLNVAEKAESLTVLNQTQSSFIKLSFDN